MNHIMCRHYNANYGCLQCLKEVYTVGQQLKNHLKISMGFPKASTPSSSEKEPMPQGSQKSSQVSLHHSQHPKKKKLDSAKKSNREGSHSKVHKKSTCRKEEMPKKKCHWWDKADKSRQIPQEVNHMDGTLLMSILLQLCVPKVAHLFSQKCCFCCSFNHHFTYILHNPLHIKFFSHS